MKTLSKQGMTIVVLPRKIGFVVDRVIFMDAGQIIDVGSPEHFFTNASHDRTTLVFNQIQ